MKLVLLSGITAALSIQNQIPVHRYDIDMDEFSKGVKSYALKAFTIDTRFSKITTNIKASDSIQTPFSIDFTCSINNSNLCNKAKTGFTNAANLIAKALNIKTTINVQATFKSFCSGQSNCDKKDTLGLASAATYFAARTNDAGNDWFFYPQALVKQLQTNIDVQYNKYDIVAEFNADFPFWFRGDSAITSNQTDFEFVIAHEFTHGLGFETGWASWGDVFNANVNLLAPMLNTQDSITVTTWQPVNIFDRFVQTAGGKSFLDYVRQIYQLNPTGKNLSSMPSILQNSPAAAFSQDAFDQVSSGGNAIQFASGSTTTSSQKVSLYTANKFLSGTSISHVDLSLSSTSDFLMVPSVQNLKGMTLDTIMAQRGASSVYGPQTLAVMTSIGWNTPGSSNSQPLTINPNGDAFRGNAHRLTPYFGIILLTILLK